MAEEAISREALAFRQMLVKLDSKITPQELEKMKMYCKDYIGARNRDQIRSFVALCEKLEERKLLDQKQLSFLKDLLQHCTDGRMDVLDLLSEYLHQNHENGGVKNQSGEDLKNEIAFLVNNLGRDWKFFMRALGVEEAVLDMCVEAHPRNVREQIHGAFKEWKGQSNSVISREAIISALKYVSRNDLAYKISAGIHMS